jgi:DNA invertase Pin-like site-specific DNA recombinase
MWQVSNRGKQTVLIGYARTSTTDQTYGLEAQLRDLKAQGCEKVFNEQVSSVDVANREKLAAALDYVREGDTLVAMKIDRLARNVAHLFSIVEAVKAKGANLRIVELNIDTGAATGELILTLLGGIAQFERRIMLERQREGIARAKGEGKFTGRQKTAQARTKEVLALHAKGLKPEAIAAQLSQELDKKNKPRKISSRSVYRIIQEQKAA